MIRQLTRPFRPIELEANALEFFALHELGEELRHQEEYQRGGVAAVTLARDAHMTMLLVALRQGDVMREHRAPSAGMALFLSGRGEFVSGGGGGEKRSAFEPGTLAAFSSDLSHAVEAREDSLYLVAIGGRERPEGSS